MFCGVRVFGDLWPRTTCGARRVRPPRLHSEGRSQSDSGRRRPQRDNLHQHEYGRCGAGRRHLSAATLDPPTVQPFVSTGKGGAWRLAAACLQGATESPGFVYSPSSSSLIRVEVAAERFYSGGALFLHPPPKLAPVEERSPFPTSPRHVGGEQEFWGRVAARRAPSAQSPDTPDSHLSCGCSEEYGCVNKASEAFGVHVFGHDLFPSL